jgi:ubiquinone/menaquinone biosynthesis C-methylase UbiE
MEVWAETPGQWQYTTDLCLKQIETHLPPGPYTRLLDVGCGCGRLTIPVALAHPDARVLGIDPSHRMLALAGIEAAAAGTGNVTWMLGGAADLRLFRGHEPYDAAFSVVVLQHLTRPDAAAIVNAVGRVLRPGGRFIFQIVSDIDFEDEGHLPDELVQGWIADAGLTSVHAEQDGMGGRYPDWRWHVAER